jgi:hypothetical protein
LILLLLRNQGFVGSERGGKSLALGCPVGDGGIDLAFPLIGKFNDEARPARSTCQRKDIVKDGALLIPVIGFTQRVPERPVEIEHARRLHQHGQFFYLRQRNRGHTTSLNLACQQSHGPRADRSGGYQDDEIDARLLQERANLAPRRQEVQGIKGKAKAVVGLGHTTNDAFRLQLK